MKSLFKEFRDFVMRGNVLDLAVGVIIATAFGKITTSLVNDVFMPFIGWLIGDIDLTAFNITLAEAEIVGGQIVKEAVTLGIGSFLATIIDFVLVALVVFLVVKAINKARDMTFKKHEEDPAPEAVTAPTSEELLAQILDEIKKQNVES